MNSREEVYEDKIAELEKRLSKVEQEMRIMMNIFLTDNYEPRYAYKPKHAKKKENEDD